MLLLWMVVLENAWFPTGQQEYGVLAVAAWDRGRPDAEPVLLQFVADQIGRPVDRATVVAFALPVPDWLYPLWLVAVAGFVLVLARWMIGLPGAATAGRRVSGPPRRDVAGPERRRLSPSALPWLLLAVAVAVDVVFLVPMPNAARALLGSLVIGLAAVGGAAAQQERAPIPPIDPAGFGAGTLVLAVLWLAAQRTVRARWAG